MEWSIPALSESLQMTQGEVCEYFKDGRTASFIIERRLAKELDFHLAPTNAQFDLTDEDGGKWEVRCLTKRGVYFMPSNQVGSGRFFDEAAFHQKLETIAGYIVADITEFPVVPFDFIQSHQVADLKRPRLTWRKYYETIINQGLDCRSSSEGQAARI